jgi:hypothetical protein
MSMGFILLSNPTTKDVISKAKNALILNLLISIKRISIPIPTMRRGMIVWIIEFAIKLKIWWSDAKSITLILFNKTD